MRIRKIRLGKEEVKKTNRNRRNTKNGRGGLSPLVYLLVALLLAGGVLLLLEKFKKPAGQAPPGKPPIVAGKKRVVPPPRPAVTKPGVTEPKEKPAEKAKPGATVKLPPVHKRYTSQSVTPPAGMKPEAPVGRGAVAIIIDDMGTSTAEVRALMAIGVPLTFAVIPGLRQSEQVAQIADSGGYQVLIHVPMEPKDYPRRRLEANGLLLSQDNTEIGDRMAGYLRQVPHAVGANNHMGSRFTEDRERMRQVLGVLKRRGLFFVDSLTTSGSVGIPLSHEMGVRSVARNVFIDNSTDVNAIKAQLGTLARLAAKKGSAVGICHPHQATIRALEEELPVLRGRGVHFVYVSKLAR